MSTRPTPLNSDWFAIWARADEIDKASFFANMQIATLTELNSCGEWRWTISYVGRPGHSSTDTPFHFGTALDEAGKGYFYVGEEQVRAAIALERDETGRTKPVKWIALALFLLVAVAIAGWLRTRPSRAPLVWSLLGFLPFVLGPWHLIVAPYATPMWSGYVKGWEFSLLDGVALGILFGTRGRWPRMTLLLPFLGYLLAVAVALHEAKFGKLAFSYFLQLLRVFAVFMAVARVTPDEKGERAVLTGLILGLAVQAGYALWARANGALQTGGSLGHQNLLGFVSHIPLMIAFAMFLAGRWPKIAILGVLAGLGVVILTASRATIAFSGIGLILTLTFSLALRFTGRKAVVGAAGVVLLAASFPLAQIALERRFEAQRTSFFQEDQERAEFEKAAKSMISSNPMGIGPNHYVFIANTEGYSSRAGVTWATASRSTNVHNSYLLIAAETGYLGITAFLLLLGCTLWRAFAGALRFRRQSGAEVLIGIGCGLLAMCLHGLYEWMFVVYPAQYVFAVGLGLIAGLWARYRQIKKRAPSRSTARLAVTGQSPDLTDSVRTTSQAGRYYGRSDRRTQS